MTLPFGFGAFHTGFQIFGWEVCYGEGRGIAFLPPRTVRGACFRKALRLGSTACTVQEFSALLDTLRPQFRGDDYHIIGHNCNDFTNELCRRLLGRTIPNYVNKLAKFAQFCAAFLPVNKLPFLGGDPTAAQLPLDKERGMKRSRSEVEVTDRQRQRVRPPAPRPPRPALLATRPPN